jgi:hypothetical protein
MRLGVVADLLFYKNGKFEKNIVGRKNKVQKTNPRHMLPSFSVFPQNANAPGGATGATEPSIDHLVWRGD